MASTPKLASSVSQKGLEHSHQKAGLLNQPISVWAVFFASIIAFMGIGLVNPILRELSVQLKATPSEVTLLFTSYNVVMAFAMLITGTVSSRLSQKWTLLTGIGIIAIVSAFGGFANNIWTLVGLRGVWGLGNALFVATSLAAIVSLSKSGTAKAIILYEAAVGIGISVGPLLGGSLGSITWRAPFFGVAILMAVAFIILIVLMPKSSSVNVGTAATVKVGKPKTSILDPFRAMKHRSLLTLGIVAALYNIGFFTIMAYAPFVMGVDPKGMGYVFLGWGLLLAITSVFTAPKLQEWFGTIKAMVMMLFLFVLDLALMGIFTSTQWVVIAAVICAGAILGNSNTLITTAVMNASPVEKSTASASYSFLRFIGAAISPYMAGKLAEIFNPHVPFFVGAGFVLLSVVFIWFNMKHIRHVDTAESGH
ncbi:putative MFS family arabinose efflux permease [Bacillus niacini]|uniref:MFS family arabinose efflux permease n=1 Tax=Neobacillus niacini TaxID=86668 RepID=A0A852TMH6_9BACI|nr:MFS transporter [Neobacillus niacini]NYE09589.1 putative MFS family arabinose efflux permease [Neobacillus niacini]